MKKIHRHNSSTSTDDTVPSAKSVKTELDKKINNGTACHYMVKNGICYVALDIVNTSASTTVVTLPNIGLPKASFDFIHRNIAPYNTTGGTVLTVAIANGRITLYNGINGNRYLDSFSYTVAES